MFFVPFAAVYSASPAAAKLLWHALNLACLGVGVWLSVKTWQAVRGQVGLRERPWLPMLFAPLFAVLLPLQTNFEHQNVNALLLALLAGATWQLTLGSATAAGLLIGAAAALKAFPALLILYLAARRYWTAALAATASAVLLTLAPLISYGVGGLSDLLSTFWRLANGGWPIRGNNQSLIAAIDRLPIGNLSAGADRVGVQVASDAPLTTVLFAALALVLVGALVVVFLTTPRRQVSVPVEVAAVTVLAVLLSPIAWDHYWTILFPAFLIAYDSADRRLLGQTGRYAFWMAAVLTTGLSPLTLGRTGFNMARDLSVYTAAALIVFLVLIEVCRRLSPGDTRAAGRGQPAAG
jgi:hypothetical protein